MVPTLIHGDYVIASRLFMRVNVNDLVVVNHPILKNIVKRISSISKDNKILLCGDSPKSITCEHMGEINQSQIIAKVIFSIKR